MDRCLRMWWALHSIPWLCWNLVAAVAKEGRQLNFNSQRVRTWSLSCNRHSEVGFSMDTFHCINEGLCPTQHITHQVGSCFQEFSLHLLSLHKLPNHTAIFYNWVDKNVKKMAHQEWLCVGKMRDCFDERKKGFR